jgi:hypothetical protein
MSTKPRKKDRSPANAEPDAGGGDPIAPPARKARATRDHSGDGRSPSASGKAKAKARKAGPVVARRREDPTAGIWTPAIVAVPVALCVLFAVVFMLLVKSSTNPPPPPAPAEEASPPPRPVLVDPAPAGDADPSPAARQDPPDEPTAAPSSSSPDDAPLIEGDE